MRYCKKTPVDKLRRGYKKIIGWGAGGEFKKRAQFFGFIDFIVDTGEKGTRNIGTKMCNIPICSPIELKKLGVSANELLIIIFPNIETEIISSIKNYIAEEVDTIMARLVDFENDMQYYSVDREDEILLNLVEKLGYEKNVNYVDIGVCHPVVRNNTFLLYENGYENGLLIEPNIVMAELCKEYRPNNVTLNVGVTSGELSEKMIYYYSCRHPGLNTFSKQVADRRPLLTEKSEIEVLNINKVLEENCKGAIRIIDIDTEGMDFELLKALDTSKFDVEIICAEGDSSEFGLMMFGKGFVKYKKTYENVIYVKKSILFKLEK